MPKPSKKRLATKVNGEKGLNIQGFKRLSEAGQDGGVHVQGVQKDTSHNEPDQLIDRNGNGKTQAADEIHAPSDTQQMVSTHGLLPDPQSPLQKGTTDLVSGQDQDQFDQYSSVSSSMLLPPIHSGPFLPNCNPDSSPTTRISSIASDNQHSTRHVQPIDAVSSQSTPSSRPHSTPSFKRQFGVDLLCLNSGKNQNTNSPISCPSKCLQSGSNKCTQKVATSSVTPDEKVGETEVSDLAERPVVKKGRFSLPIPTHPHNQP